MADASNTSVTDTAWTVVPAISDPLTTRMKWITDFNH